MLTNSFLGTFWARFW